MTLSLCVPLFLPDSFFVELELMRASDPSQKALVFSSFTQFLSIIESHLSKAGFITCRFVGSMSQKQRADVMREFNKDGGPNVMVISLKAGNAGINLVRANHVYLMDPWCVPVDISVCPSIVAGGIPVLKIKLQTGYFPLVSPN
jgi:hypothetical protein